ncbi:MAG TPA: LptA/OstA family protein [Vicinamibacterales bacterium]|nr:LptA/OstA family protein [Vicinamibacterales bacterium]
MRWQRYARALVAVIGIGCAVALYTYSRKKPPHAPPPPQVAVDPEATVQSGAGRLVRQKGNEEIGTIDYQSTKTYADGRMVFEQPHIVSSGNRGFEAWADKSETKGKSPNVDNPGKMEFTGHVRVHMKDGLELLSDSAVYDDATGGVEIPGPMSFSRGKMSGRGVGAVYDRGQDLLTVQDQSHIDVAPGEDGKGAMSANAKTVAVDRLHKQTRLDVAATLTHDAETLAGDTANLYWTDDEKHLRLIELRGHASVTQAAGAAANSPPDMRGDDIDLTFHPDGQTLHLASIAGRTMIGSLTLIDETGRRSVSGSKVDLAVAPDGGTVTSLTAQKPVRVELPKTADNPARTITAQSLVSQGNEKEGLKQARFDGGVDFVETVPGTKGAKDSVRTGKSQTLVLGLNGKLDAIDRATFTQNATFTDGDVRGDADEAQYFATAGKLFLRPAARGARKMPHVDDGDLTVDAQQIDIDINTDDLDARGDVKTRNRPSAPSATPQTKSALFDFNDPNRPIYGTSEKLKYTSDSGRAVYTGTPETLARTWQDQNSVQGDEVTVETGTHNLKAVGHVNSVYFLTPAADATGRSSGPPPKPTEYRGNADSLDYRDAEHIATYVGTPATLKSADSTTTAPRIDVTFNDQGNSIDQLIATGGAYAQLEGGREAVGQKLVYVAATETYTLTGSTATPARVKLPNSDKSGCTKSTGEKLTFTKQSGSADGARQTESIVCTVSIKDPIK